ncbi:MAG: hypothetical protein ETSY1_14795 [Candidatus Entotheonella factor]|uniref:Uncharacterized protein n=1 Tax=Entotheonella factor TaxID=1429438 RepID=W4LNR7_ENTF1|nr:MAG: hypothetical protein ETSY1_14795 [Candidatus Entotheonella factor]
MATESKRLVEFVAKLNRMTQEGHIDWEMLTLPGYIADNMDGKIAMFFGAMVHERYLGLYVRRYTDFHPLDGEMAWMEQPELAICNEDWMPVWKFPSVSGIPELLEAVKRHWSGADHFIDSFLAEDD